MAIVGPFRVQFFWTQQASRLGGWSENFWNNQSSTTGVQKAAANLQEQLFFCKGWGVNGPWIRISQVPASRKAQPIPTNLTSAFTGGNNDADYPTSALLMKFTGATTGQVVNQWMRGIPDSVVNTGGRYDPSKANFGRNFTNMVSLLTTPSNGWCVRVNPPANAQILITAVTLAGVVTAPGHGIVGKGTVRISRTGGIPGLNGAWSVTVIDTNNLQLLAIPGGAFSGSYSKIGYIRNQTWILDPIANCTIQYATEHKVGRPFGQLTGRRRKRGTTGS